MCTSVERGKKERGLGGKKGAFFLLEATLFFAPLHLAACSQANRKIVLSFFSLNASKTNKQTRQEWDALFFHLAPILLFFCSSNTDSVTKRNRLVGPSWLGFE